MPSLTSDSVLAEIVIPLLSHAHVPSSENGAMLIMYGLIRIAEAIESLNKDKEGEESK
jgi:hypothetical protein